MLLRGQILEAMHPQVAQPTLSRELCSRCGNHGLPSMRCSRDPRRTVHVDADVTAVYEERSAGVHPDTHLHGAPTQSLVRLARGGERAGGSIERDEECVSLRVDLDAPVSSERIA